MFFDVSSFIFFSLFLMIMTFLDDVDEEQNAILPMYICTLHIPPSTSISTSIHSIPFNHPSSIQPSTIFTHFKLTFFFSFHTRNEWHLFSSFSFALFHLVLFLSRFVSACSVHISQLFLFLVLILDFLFSFGSFFLSYAFLSSFFSCFESQRSPVNDLVIHIPPILPIPRAFHPSPPFVWCSARISLTHSLRLS